MPEVTLITGGGRSGKSAFAVQRARAYARRAFVATATAFDAEMAARIAAHQGERGAAFRTVEAPLDLAGAITGLRDVDVAVVDCLTVWLGNLMHHHGSGAVLQAAMADFLSTLAQAPCDLLIVTNEVGMGIIPDNAMAREFRDLAGALNVQVAARAQRVLLMVAGLPLALKGNV